MTDLHDNPYQTQISKLETKIKENQALLEDPELSSLAAEEIAKLSKQLDSLQTAATDYHDSIQEQEAAQADPTLQSNAILELRAGAGGDEAKIWAGDLLRMYIRYCETKNLKVEFIDDLVVKISKKTELILEQPNPKDPKTIRQIKKTFYPYQLFKHEAGVHRVQRVPTTETQGRIHTSTASIAVLPEIKSNHIEVRDEDLIWEFIRSSGAGGQSVNKTSSAVRLTHKPSGIMVRVSQERKQLQNRQIALELLRSQLWEIEEEKQAAKLGKARAAIGRNMRAEKIRTFNYPQNRVTDHRINHSWHQLENIIEGDLNPVITTVKQELAKAEQEDSQSA